MSAFTSIEKQKKKDENFIPDVNARYREDYLFERLGKYEEYDVNASILRISIALANKGDMGDLNDDLYKKIFSPFVGDYKQYFNSDINEWCDEVRRFFKSIFMRLFFGGSPKRIAQNILASEKRLAKKSVDDTPYMPFLDIEAKGGNLTELIEKW